MSMLKLLPLLLFGSELLRSEKPGRCWGEVTAEAGEKTWPSWRAGRAKLGRRQSC